LAIFSKNYTFPYGAIGKNIGSMFSPKKRGRKLKIKTNKCCVPYINLANNNEDKKHRT